MELKKNTNLLRKKKQSYIYFKNPKNQAWEERITGWETAVSNQYRVHLYKVQMEVGRVLAFEGGRLERDTGNFLKCWKCFVSCLRYELHAVYICQNSINNRNINIIHDSKILVDIPLRSDKQRLCQLPLLFKIILTNPVRYKSKRRASLVGQWLRICLPMQGTQVWALVQEDPTCREATKPVCHNYWACALEPASHNYWARVPQLPKPAWLEPALRNKRSHRNEKPSHCNEK